MIPNDHSDAAEALRVMLAQHHTVSILVAPSRCAGLSDLLPAKAVRLDLSHHFPIPMHITVDNVGLEFSASFSRVSRWVRVPWGALLWAGVPRQHDDAEQVMTPEAKPAANETPACLCIGAWGDTHTCGLGPEHDPKTAPAFNPHRDPAGRAGLFLQITDNVVHVDFSARRRKP